MTAIAPNSTIKLGQSPLRYGSEDTMFWNNKTEQMNGIFSEVVITFPRCTYQRDRRGYVRVEGNAEAYDYCNYMAFQNTNYVIDPSKWFYCFVLDIEYINNETMEIHYEIDYLQTYYFDYADNSCFVERCHSLTDNIGDNILPEGLDTGEYVYNDNNTIADLTQTDVIVLDADDDSSLSPLGDVLENTFVGMRISGYQCDFAHRARLRQLIEDDTTTQAIKLIYIVPRFLRYFYGISDNAIEYSVTEKPNVVKFIDMPGIQDNYTLDNYTPKNKKLYTYPFCFYEVTDGNGNTMNMRYEFMTNPLSPRIGAYVTISPPATIVFKPINYKNTGYVEQTLTITGFPMCAWTYDAFDAWLSRSLTPQLIKTGATALGMGVGFGMGYSHLYNHLINNAPFVPITPATPGSFMDNPALRGRDLTQAANFKSNAQKGAAVAAGYAIGDMLSNGYSAAISGGLSQGNYTNNGSLIPVGISRIMGTRVSVSKDYAKAIDDYFTAYGYAYKKFMPIGESHRKRRSRFTYIKTVDANITGELPQDARVAIAARYDNGVRFWADHLHMYDYSLDNTVLS